jgi:transcription termination/antitermination protein NusA
MASPISANRAELLAIATSVANEKLIDKSIVIEAMEEAIQKSARNRYGAENDIRAKLDPRTGDLRLWRVVEVVEEVEDYFKQVDLKAAQKLDANAKLGDFIVDPLPPVDLGRIDAQSAKQVIFQKVRDAERERQYEEFKDRAGELITGRDQVGRIRPRHRQPRPRRRRDPPRSADPARGRPRGRARPRLILKVERQNRGPQIFLSRAHPDFMKKLFAQEVPEIYDSIIEIKAAARDPGSRAKIGVISRDSSDRPGRRLRRHEGQPRPGGGPGTAGREDRHHPLERGHRDVRGQRAAAGHCQPRRHRRGRKPHRSGRARRPAVAGHRPPRPERAAGQPADRSQIDIMTEAESSEKRQKEFAERSKMFEEELDVDETLSQLLVAEGFSELEEVAYIELAELATIEGFDEELAEELQSRARKRWSAARPPSANSAAALGVEDALAEIPHLTEQMLVTLGKAGIKTLDDLADLATDELIAKKRVEQRRRDGSAPRARARAGQGRRAGRIWPERRAGQRDHHGRARPLVRRRAG